MISKPIFSRLLKIINDFNIEKTTGIIAVVTNCFAGIAVFVSADN
jgi:hypothetical protein